MATKAPPPFGVLNELEQAEKAIDDLRQAGFPAEEIRRHRHVGTEQQTIPNAARGDARRRKRDDGMRAAPSVGAPLWAPWSFSPFQAWPGPPARACGSRSWAAPS